MKATLNLDYGNRSMCPEYMELQFVVWGELSEHPDCNLVYHFS